MAALYLATTSHGSMTAEMAHHIREAIALRGRVKDKITEDAGAPADYTKLEGAASAFGCTATMGDEFATAFDQVRAWLDTCPVGYLAQLDLGKSA